MNNTQVLQIMALDLKRVALGYHSGSLRMADRFLQEVLTRKSQLQHTSLPDSLKLVLHKIQTLPTESDIQHRADNALTYSTLLLSFSRQV